MPVEEVLIVLVGTLILGGLVVIANYAERKHEPRLRWAIMVSLVGLSGLMILGVGFQVIAAYTPEADDLDPVGKTSAWTAFILATVTTVATGAFLFRNVRERIAVLFPRQVIDETAGDVFNQSGQVPHSEQVITARLPVKQEGHPLFPQMLNYYMADASHAPQPVPLQDSLGYEAELRQLEKPKRNGIGYDPSSIVHTVALMLCVLLLGSQFVGFVLGGGLEGVAESYSGGLSAWDVILSGLPQIIIPVLGVGIGVRRSLPQALKRLGLEIPTPEGLAAALGATFVLLMFIVAVGLLWQGLVSEETFNEQNQASEALSDSIGTIWMALLISLMAGVSEEIAFRGALQPVFGLWPTAIIFALFHLQYTLTPATLIILSVAVSFGWLRQRYNTTVAILAHFLYNFVQLALAVSLPEDAASWLISPF